VSFGRAEVVHAGHSKTCGGASVETGLHASPRHDGAGLLIHVRRGGGNQAVVVVDCFLSYLICIGITCGWE